MKRSDKEIVYPGFFTFPGGKVEGNETLAEALAKEVAEECGLIIKPGLILLKEKAIGRPDGTTSKSLSFLCAVEDESKIELDHKDFSEYQWVNISELRQLKHVGLEAEFKKAEIIANSGYALEPLFIDTDSVDFRPS